MKTLIFKIQQFPHLSETFIIAQIITAVHCGFKVKILVTELLDIEETSHEGIFKKYSLKDKVIIEDYSIPSNKFLRSLKWIKKGFKNIHQLKQVIQFHNHKKSFSLTWLYQFDFYNKFKEADVIHVQYGTNINPVDVLKKIGHLKAKLIVSFHGHDAFFPINGFIPNNGYYNDLFGYGDMIIANTPYLAEQIKTLSCPEEKIHVVPVGVNTDFFYPNKKVKTIGTCLRLITVGRLDKVKGHQYAIELLNLLIKKDIEASLTIVGEGKERENLEYLIESKNLQDVVFITGRKSQEEVKKFLWSHDLYILCAVPVANERRETQGLATIEAQACGLPVIAFDSGGVKYTIEEGKTGYLVPEKDIDAMASIIQKIHLSKDKFFQMSEAATLFAKNEFSLKKLNKTWAVIYNA